MRKAAVLPKGSRRCPVAHWSRKTRLVRPSVTPNTRAISNTHAAKDDIFAARECGLVLFELMGRNAERGAGWAERIRLGLVDADVG